MPGEAKKLSLKLIFGPRTVRRRRRCALELNWTLRKVRGPTLLRSLGRFFWTVFCVFYFLAAKEIPISGTGFFSSDAGRVLRFNVGIWAG